MQREDDVRAIETLIAAQTANLAWTPECQADWEGFAQAFVPGALLVQSPRPAQPRTVDQFVARQQGLARGALRSYGQRLLGTQVSVFGAIAVALAACDMSENGIDIARNVAAILLIKDGAWKIARQAWDRASAERPVPVDLGGAGAAAQQDDDARAIAGLIHRQFESLTWAPGRPADWEGFARDFLPGAWLFPSARPVRPQTVPQFVARMQELARGTLHIFDERVLGTAISVFGNVAVARAACAITENGTARSRNVEALLLVKDGAWKIAGQAWDRASAEQPVPADLGGTG
jgi:hypothetical protein